MLPCEASQNDVEKKCGEPVKTHLRTYKSDSHTVNKSYFKQLVDFYCSFLPAVVSDFNNLSANQLSGLVCMNHVFCGIHAIHNVGSVCKEAKKEFEEIAGDIPHETRGPFQKSEACTCSLLQELSKAFTKGHNYQKAGVPHSFEAYLSSIGAKKSFCFPSWGMNKCSVHTGRSRTFSPTACF